MYEQSIRDNNHNIGNLIGSNRLTTNSNSCSLYRSGSDEENYLIKNNLLFNNMQDESFYKEISHDLLTQLIILNTLN